MSTTLIDRLRAVSPRARRFIVVAAAIAIVDQFTKWLAVAHLTRAFVGPDGAPLGFAAKLSNFLWLRHPEPEGFVRVIDKFWHFRYVENPGAAWGFLAGSASWFRTPFFVIVAIAAMTFIVIYFRRTLPQQKLLRAALMLVFGGAIGNFIDRIRLGYVIDFIDWHWYDTALRWPTFNVADAAISVGVVLLILDMILHPKDHEEAQKAHKKSGAQQSENGA